MTENRNRKKRIRDNEEPQNGPTNSANAPPIKKRRVQIKSIQKRKPRNKDMTKWSIDELRRYLNQNAITYQLNKDKPYYLRLAQIHRIKRNKDEKQRQIERKSSFPSAMMNGGNSSNPSNDSTQPQSPRDNSNDDNSETPNSPIFSAPKGSTPPLPPNLSRRPLTADNNDEDSNDDEDEEEEEELSQTNLSQNKPRTMIKSPPRHKQQLSEEMITPHSYKSHPMINRATPSQPPQITNEATLITHHQHEQEQQSPATPIFITPRPFDIGSQESNNSAFSNESDNNHEITNNNIQHIRYQHGAAQNIPYQQSAPTETRMGPFQDLGKVFSFDGYSMPQIPKMRGLDIPRLNRGILGGENKYLILLCGAVAIILMAMCIPYIIALFVQTPFCDNGGDGISGTYAVLNGIVPLQSIMSCKPCPFNATCKDGEPHCDDNYHLDEPYNVICLADIDGNDANIASDIAHRVNYILGGKYGEYVCDNTLGEESYEFDEKSLKQEVGRKYYHVLEDKDDREQSAESSSDDSDNIDIQQKEDESDDDSEEQQDEESNEADKGEDKLEELQETQDMESNNIDIQQKGDESDDDSEEQQDEEPNEADKGEDMESNNIDIQENEDDNKRDEEQDEGESNEGEDKQQEIGENEDMKVNEGENENVNDVLNDNENENVNDENFNELQKPSQELNNNEDENVNEPVSDILNEEIGVEAISDSSFDAAWNYAKTKIIPSAYKQTIIISEDSKYKSLRPIPPTYYCRGLYLYREYIEKPQKNKNVDIAIIWGFALIVIVVLIIILCLLNKAKEVDPEAIGAANFVLEKLSHQQTLHFSIDQLKRYCMNRQKISLKTWEKALEYINESHFVQVIPEDIDGEIRMCWKWKAPVPFVPLQVN